MIPGMLRALLVAATFSLAACPGLETAGVPKKCAKQYEKCKLPTGPLGVCDRVPCPEGQTDPCLKCIPQH
jgi:hypothetical protein